MNRTHDWASLPWCTVQLRWNAAGGRASTTDDGPLTLATDLLVWNITKDDLRLREVIVDPESWPAPPASKPGEPDESAITPFSDFVNSGRLDVAGAFAKEIEEFKKKNGLE
jgi:hypothetical protein